MFDVGVMLGERYLLVSLVARGGMGEVWSAQEDDDSTRTTLRQGTGWTEAAPAPAPVPKRLLIAGAAVATAAIVAVLIVALTPGGAETPQSQGTSRSAGASPGMSPSTSVGTGTPSRTTTPAASTASTAASTASTAAPVRTTQAAQTTPPPASATVPNMYGWTENEVVGELRRLGLVERITYRWTPDKCYAIEQTPGSGTVLPRGSTVSVTVAKATGQCKQV